MAPSPPPPRIEPPGPGAPYWPGGGSAPPRDYLDAYRAELPRHLGSIPEDRHARRPGGILGARAQRRLGHQRRRRAVAQQVGDLPRA
ncbi:hypothetical protein, partial [Nocardia wallacei]|uniref:hypothetical protein n=1 Tax=Nocardia wallacei TaxID=480035 RepID=UPI00245608EB